MSSLFLTRLGIARQYEFDKPISNASFETGTGLSCLSRYHFILSSIAIRDSVKTLVAHYDCISYLDKSVVQETAQHSPLVRYLFEANFIRYRSARFTVKCQPYPDTSNPNNSAGFQFVQIKPINDNVLSEVSRTQVELCQRLRWHD